MAGLNPKKSTTKVLRHLVPVLTQVVINDT